MTVESRRKTIPKSLYLLKKDRIPIFGKDTPVHKSVQEFLNDTVAKSFLKRVKNRRQA